MARPLRINYSGAFYHVYHRGLERREIYKDEHDYAIFVKLLEQAHIQFKVKIHAYCLMSNHYHLYVETPEGNLSRVMRHVNGLYTQKYNKKYSRVGSLFQGRYGSKLVDQHSYSLELVRYIHLNPVKAKMVKSPGAYAHSSYRVYQGRKQGFEGLETNWLLKQFGRKSTIAIREFEKYTLAGLAESWQPEESQLGRVMIGTEKFFEEIRDKYLLGKKDTELSELREIKRTADLKKIEKWIEQLDLDEKHKRKCVAYVLKKYTPLKLSEIAEKIGRVSYSGVAQMVRRLEQERLEDKHLARELNRLEHKMSKVKT